MKLPKMRLLLPLCFYLVCGLALAAPPPAPMPEVLRAEFGLFASAADTRDNAFFCHRSFLCVSASVTAG